MRRITVKGTGNVSVKPDLIVLSLDLSTQLSTYEETMKQATQASQELLNIFLELGFDKDDLKTTDFTIDTVYESYQDAQKTYQRRFVGYECRQDFRLEFDLDFERLSKVLSALVQASVDPVFNIRFSVKDLTKVSEELLRNAAKNAKEKAEILADASGVKLGEIVDIHYNWGRIELYSPTDYRLNESNMRMAAEASPHIVPEDIDVSDEVTFVWEIK